MRFCLVSVPAPPAARRVRVLVDQNVDLLLSSGLHQPCGEVDARAMRAAGTRLPEAVAGQILLRIARAAQR